MREVGRASFFKKLRRLFGVEPLQRLSEAYQLAKAIHRPHVRKTGERYIAHPKAVAMILMRYRPVSVEEVIVALMHDCIEDGYMLPSVLEKLFGFDVRKNVCFLTKYEVILCEDGAIVKTKKPREIYEGCLLGGPLTAQRVKCADRIHNLSTMLTLSIEHRRQQVAETERFYLPLAKTVDPRLYRVMLRACNRVKRSLQTT